MSKIHTGKNIFKGQIVQTEATITAAATTNLAALGGNIVSITGDTTIASFGTVDAGAVFVITFTGTPTITHNGTSLILPGAANITAAAGDVMTIKSLGSGNWKCVSYEKVNGKAIIIDPVSQIIDSTYPAGETLSAGNAVFIENAPTTSQATSAQNIGDVTANTRVSFPVFGSGVAGSDFLINIAKNGSPSVPLNVRIETDNAGSPSGNLVHANATWTPDTAKLGTTLKNGYTNVVNDDGIVLNYGDNGTPAGGYRIQAKANRFLAVINKNSNCGATTAYVKSDTGTTLATATFVGNVATLSTPLWITTGTYYRVLVDSAGASFARYSKSGATFPSASTDIDYIQGFYDTTTSSSGWNIDSIETYETFPNLAGSITIPAGQKCHLVTYQGTYGAETVNASNYYKIGYYTNDTGTRNIKRYNGSIWTDGTASSVSDSANFTNNDGSTGTAPYGYRIYAKIGSYLISVTKSSACTATRALLKNDAGTTLSTATFSGNTATFADPSYMSASTYYRIEVDSSGASYSWRTQYSGGLPVNATNVNFTSGSQNGSGTTDLAKYNIESVVTISENYKAFPYTSSTLFQPRVLSKTDADYSYKIDWHGITQEAVTAGDLTTGKYPKIALPGSIDSNQTGMTQNDPQFLSNTAGAISSSIGTNPISIGKSISYTKIQIQKEDVVYPNTTVIATMGDAVKTDDGLNTYTKLRESQIMKTGTYTIKYRIVGDTGSGSCSARVYKNGVAYGSITNLTTESFVDSFENLAFGKGDLIQIYGATNGDGLTVSLIQICGSTEVITVS